MNKLLSGCPVCQGRMHPSELACEGCGTTVRSEFESCRFCALTQEQLHFVTLFLRSRGNITAVGDELDISYPTVTRRLDAVLTALGIPPPGVVVQAVPAQPAAPVVTPAPLPPPAPEPPAVDTAAAEAEASRQALQRLEILDKLDRGEITADEATRLLKDL